MKTTPRTAFHSLQPVAVGTTQTESLLSYFCRLAVSHAVSTHVLARALVRRHGHGIRPDFEWQHRNLSGVGEAAHTWAAWLSEETGVGNLDGLTLSRWADVLPASGLAPLRGRWCPHCLKGDREQGKQPYFRLSWDVAPVSVCYRHKTQLVDTCPHCQKPHVRHHGAVVVPGWCTRCGGFLGDAPAEPASPEAMWVARQVGDLIADQASFEALPAKENIGVSLAALILKLDGGRYVSFARRIAVSKSSVHGWLNKGVVPSLGGYLQVALHAGIPLTKLMRGDLDAWTPPAPAMQLGFAFETMNRLERQSPRTHDWGAIRLELERMLKQEVPISVAEVGRRLGLDDRHLYLRANDLARALGERWKAYQQSRKAANRAQVKADVKAACRLLIEDGQGCSLREIRQMVPVEALDSVEGVFDLIREAREELG